MAESLHFILHFWHVKCIYAIGLSDIQKGITYYILRVGLHISYWKLQNRVGKCPVKTVESSLSPCFDFFGLSICLHSCMLFLALQYKEVNKKTRASSRESHQDGQRLEYMSWEDKENGCIQFWEQPPSGGPKSRLPVALRRLSRRWQQAIRYGGRTRDNGQKLKQWRLYPSGY